jgi:hypothetical protein
MKKTCIFLLTLAVSAPLFSQKTPTDKIKASVTKDEIKAHMTFLASDAMRGRDTGSPEIAIAADYLAKQFSDDGLKKVPGMESYFQEVGLHKSVPPKKVELKLGEDTFLMTTDLLLANGKSMTYDGEIVFAGYGNPDDFNGIDVKGKVVVCYTGSSEKSSINEAFGEDSPKKHKLAVEKGAIAIIELMTFPQIPWQAFAGYFGRGIMTLDSDDKDTNVPHVFLRKSPAVGLDNLIQQKKINGSFSVDVPSSKKIEGKNIIGLIKGTDKKLKNEYIVLSAHYDHIGITAPVNGDSINNGARDNALGTTAILEAAKYLSKHKTKRSILIIAYTGEEKGLLGSQWYTAHPVVPLVNTVFNLDCDGAGYNDKTIATLIDLNRTTADDLLQKATTAFGLKLMGDPVPEQHLYERSDNYNFALKGVPALDFSTGVKAFDEELMKYYHKPADEVGTLDFDYLEQFVRAYVYGCSLIGDSPVTPTWKAGDKFEEAGKKLYGK